MISFKVNCYIATIYFNYGANPKYKMFHFKANTKYFGSSLFQVGKAKFSFAPKR